MTRKTTFGMEDILRILPHRAPFLFVDSVLQLVPDKKIVTERAIRDDEPWFAGHFPQKAIMPGVLVTDALAQTSGLLWGLSKVAAGEEPPERPEIFFLAAAQMKFTAPAYPGEVLEMTAQSERQFGSLYTYAVEAVVKRKVVARGTLTLAMVKGDL